MNVQDSRKLTLSIVTMLFMAATVFAQHDAHQAPAGADSASAVQVAACSQNSQRVLAGLDASNARIEDARQSNNASAMRAAVADLQVLLAQIKTQLTDCLNLSATAMSGMPGMGSLKDGTPTASPAPSSKQPSSAAALRLDITFKSQPTPLKIGENQFEVTVKGADGEPTIDADVSVLFVMPAMPAMKMPEMRNELKLKAAGGGTYTGSGQVMMAGQWNVTIRISKAGVMLGQKELTANAK